MQTIRELLAQALKRGIERPDAELILAHSLGRAKEWIIAHPEFTPSLLKSWRFKRNVSKRASGLPLAYITGHKAFFGLDFLVNKHTLIPRPETELLVEQALNIMKLHGLIHGTSFISSAEPQNTPKKNILLIDIGPGSGCIPISILKKLNNTEREKQVTAIATDISRQALRIARKNQKKHCVNITFKKQNLLPANSSFLNPELKKADLIIITANLPYITKEQYASEASIQHEPKTALVAPDQGLGLYKTLFRQIEEIREMNGHDWTQKKIHILCEIDPGQSKKLKDHAQKVFKNADISIKQDLSGLDRNLIILIDKKPPL